MTANAVLQIGLFLVVLVALVKPLGWYMARVFDGRAIGLDRVFGPVERMIYRLAGVTPEKEMTWRTYAFAMLLFNMLGLAVVYLMQRTQGLLPLNPQGFPSVTPDSAFNTAVSFASNTNWQGYGGETTMSYLTQMLALTGIWPGHPDHLRFDPEQSSCRHRPMFLKVFERLKNEGRDLTSLRDLHVIAHGSRKGDLVHQIAADLDRLGWPEPALSRNFPPPAPGDDTPLDPAFLW